MGTRPATDSLTPALYDELRLLAAWHLRRERGGHTLQPTALVHEAYLRMASQHQAIIKNRGHFMALAAQQMRRVLLDYARRRRTGKRGAGSERIHLDHVPETPADAPIDLVRLDDVLISLEKFDPQACRIVEMRFFAGMQIEEIAQALGISASTVKRDWNSARLWLFSELGDPAG
jgi:RNA polymerase sigma factor (TIGR02999 family)